MIPADATKPIESPAATVAVALPALPPKQRMFGLLTSETPPLSREFVVNVFLTETQSLGSVLPLTMSRGNLSAEKGVSVLSQAAHAGITANAICAYSEQTQAQ